MSYRTIFDITNPRYEDWTFLPLGLLFIVIGILIIWKGHLLPSRRPVSRGSIRAFGSFFLGFAVLWTVGVSSCSHSRYLHLRHLFEEGRFEVVEGVVTDFAPETAGTKIELFV